MDTVGPLARTVADCAMTLRTIAGHDPNDKITSTEPVPDYQAALTGKVNGLRVSVVRELIYTDVVEDEIRQSVSTAVETLRTMGAQVKEISIPLAANAGAINGAIRVEAPCTYQDLLRKQQLIQRFKKLPLMK